MSDLTIRPFGFWTATALVVGGMIGTGIFLLPASIAPFGWIGCLGWAISIVGVLCIAYALGRLSASMPDKTGVIAVTGAVLGPVPSVLVGWAYWVSCCVTSAALALGATSYLTVLFPSLGANPRAGAIASTAIYWALTLLNLTGAKSVGRFQVITTLLKLIPLLAVVYIAVALGFSDQLHPPQPAAGPGILAGLAATVPLALFALTGFETPGVAAERIRDPARNVIRAIMSGTLVTGLLYIAVCMGIVFALPSAVIAKSDAPVSLFIETFWGRTPALLTALFAVVSAIGSLNGWVLFQGEVPLGMSRAGLLPNWFSRVSERDVPVRGLLLSTTLGSLIVISNASKSLSGLFTFLVLMTSAAALWLYVAICIAALVRGIARAAALLGLAFSIWAMWGAGIEASGLCLLLTLTVLPLYYFKRRNGFLRRIDGPDAVSPASRGD